MFVPLTRAMYSVVAAPLPSLRTVVGIRRYCMVQVRASLQSLKATSGFTWPGSGCVTAIVRAAHQRVAVSLPWLQDQIQHFCFCQIQCQAYDVLVLYRENEKQDDVLRVRIFYQVWVFDKQIWYSTYYPYHLVVLYVLYLLLAGGSTTDIISDEW